MDAEASARGVRLTLRTRPTGETVAFGKLMGALSMLRGGAQKMSSFGVEVYEDRTVDVPLTILAPAVARLVDMGGWCPDPGELLQTCESVRLEKLAAQPWEPCANCSQQGFVERVIDGVKRMERCACWLAYRERVKAQQIPTAPLALPAAIHEAGE